MGIDAFIQQAWDTHGDDPLGVAAQLEDRLGQIASANDVAPFVRLAQHVHAEHLGDWVRGIALMRRIAALSVVRDDAAAQAAVRRASAVLTYCAGDASELDGLARDERIATMAAVGSAYGGRGDFAAAARTLDLALAEAESGIAEGSSALRALAVAGNNIAASLEEKADRGVDETRWMLRAAETGLAYWSRAGTWLETERAHHRLACSRLQAEDAAGAARSAQDCLAVCAANDAPAFERFFGHAVHAFALRALGDSAGSAAAREQALACHAQLPEAERPWCRKDLDALCS